MTKEKAIEVLKDLWRYEKSNYSEEWVRKALDMAIESLESQKTGHWIGGDVDARGYCSCFECSNCGIFIYPKILLKNLEYPNCPYCLSKMEGE